ncbi:hypothetical protein, partial [Peribacillus sp. SIMBA_075]|uniref:hypothetical protein n=1 Tax=Peribacillus sp. SIMBA_075 TaxID=3085813 RepID=UPI0039794A3C
MHLLPKEKQKEAHKPTHGHNSVVPCKKGHTSNQPTKAHRSHLQIQEDSLPSPHTALVASTGQASPLRVDTKATKIMSSHQDTRTQ